MILSLFHSKGGLRINNHFQALIKLLSFLFQQYLFSKKTVKFVLEQLKCMNKMRIICLGAPRYHKDITQYILHPVPCLIFQLYIIHYTCRSVNIVRERYVSLQTIATTFEQVEFFIVPHLIMGHRSPNLAVLSEGRPRIVASYR